MRARSAVSRRRRRSRPSRSMRIGWRFGWTQQRLLARQRALHRRVEQERGERGLRLVRHVLLAAERAAVRDQLRGDALRIDVEHRRDLVAVVPHALAAGVHRELAVGLGHDERRLGLEERVLDALGLEHVVHDVRARGERGVDVAALVRRARQHVAVELPHRVLVVVERGDRIGDRAQHAVLDLDQLRRRGARWRGRPRRRTRARRRGTTCARPRG